MGRQGRDPQTYRQSIPAIGLSLERGTPNVQKDGYFYVLVKGEIRGRFRTMREAQEAYKKLLEESGYKPPEPAAARVDPGREAVERYMDELGVYWGESHKHMRRGGKTMYRG